MIRRGKTLLQYLVDGWTLINNEEGWHIEKDAAELRVSSFAIRYLEARELIKLVATREVWQLDRSRVL